MRPDALPPRAVEALEDAASRMFDIAGWLLRAGEDARALELAHMARALQSVTDRLDAELHGAEPEAAP